MELLAPLTSTRMGFDALWRSILAEQRSRYVKLKEESILPGMPHTLDRYI
jgi:hypothetical protein